jgi:hypothetical protein
VELDRLLFRRPDLDLAALADAWAQAPSVQATAIELTERGPTLLRIGQAQGDVRIMKPDGRPYTLQFDASQPDWNAYRDAATGNVYVLADVAETGTWLADAGAPVDAGVFHVPAGTTAADVRQWATAGRYPAAIRLTGAAPFQKVLVIDGADKDAQLLRPDGTAYPFQYDQTQPGWNASYDEAQGTLTVLVNVEASGAPNASGDWKVVSSDFADIRAYDSSRKFDDLAPILAAGDDNAMSVKLDKPGTYLLGLVGGDASVKIYRPDGSAVNIVTDENNPDRNAMLNTDENTFYVTVEVDASHTGVWQIHSAHQLGFQLYEVPPVPKIASFTAAASDDTAGSTRFELQWNVAHAKPDTRVRVMLTTDPKELAGQTVAEDLPASGIRTVDLPAGYMPGDYWLVLVADSDSFGPIAEALDQPIHISAKSMLPTPQQPQIVSNGNGEIALKFASVNAPGLEFYRILTADETGAVQAAAPIYDIAPAAGETQEATLSGLPAGKTYRLAVMAVGQEDGAAVVSEPSPVATVDLPDPQRPVMQVDIDPQGAAKQDRSYKDYDGNDAKLTVTSAAYATLNVTSDQAASLELYVNGSPAGIQTVDKGGTAAFPLDVQQERDYSIEVDATSDRGDRSSYWQDLIVDRTTPFLDVYQSVEQQDDSGNVTVSEQSINGEVASGGRAPIFGRTEMGTRLTLREIPDDYEDGTVTDATYRTFAVPVDAQGEFHLYAPFPNGKDQMTYQLIAQDAAGNTTESRFAVLAGTDAGAQPGAADLAALSLDSGTFQTAFNPDQTEYAATLDAGQVRVYATPAASDSVVTVNGSPLDADGSAAVTVPESGTASIQVHIRAADNSEKTYTIAVNARLSDIAALRDLQLSSGQLSPKFQSANDTYEVSLTNNVSELSVTPVAFKPGSAIQVARSGTPLTLIDGQAVIELPSGQTTPIDITVTSPDGTNTMTYHLSVWRDAADITDLQSVAVSAGDTAATVTANGLNGYNAVVPAQAASVMLHAAAQDSHAKVSIAGASSDTVTSSVYQSVALSYGPNAIPIDVTAESGRTESYMLTVTRQTPPPAAAPALNQLSVSGFELDPAFSPLAFSYALPDTQEASVAVSASSDAPGAHVTVNGITPAAGGSVSVPLELGSNTIVIAVENADLTASRTYSIAVNRLGDDSNDSSHGAAPDQTQLPTLNLSVNDAALKDMLTVDQKQVDGKTVTNVAFQQQKVEQMLDGQGSRPVLSLNVPGEQNTLNLGLTGHTLKLMADKEATLQIRTAAAAYNLPASFSAIDEVSKQLGAGAALDQIKATLQIAVVSGEQRQQVEQQAAQSGATLLAAPVEFKLTYEYEGKSVELDKFPGYVERGLPIAPGTDPNAITTGVRVTESGIEHVPTYVKRDEATGIYWAYMKSLTNSAYTVISHQKSFADVQHHWARASIEDLASRLVVDGVNDNSFAPDALVTRAEFAAIAVRSLGIETGRDTLPFSDVHDSDWYAAPLATAYANGLLTGYEDGTIRPGQPITRQEAIVIMERAMSLTGSTNDPDASGKPELTLESAADGGAVAAWARPATTAALASGIVAGYEDGTIRPDRNVTRAETVQLLRNLLVQAKLIQP